MSKIDPKENLKRIASRDRLWAEIRDDKSHLYSLLQGREFQPLDIILMFKCILTVLNEIDMYEDNFLDVDKKMENIIKDTSVAGKMLRISSEVKYFKNIQNEEISDGKRQENIEKMKKSIWNNILQYKQELINITKLYPHLSEDQIFIVQECIQIILLELDLDNTEIKMLENF